MKVDDVSSLLSHVIPMERYEFQWNRVSVYEKKMNKTVINRLNCNHNVIIISQCLSRWAKSPKKQSKGMRIC